MKIFETVDLCYSYGDGTHALQGLSFDFHEGEKLGLVGANGSGKSTLLMHLIGCLSPSSGSVLYKGAPLTRERRRELRSRTGLLFQNPEDQLFLPTVWEDAAFGPRNLGCGEEEVSERVERALKAAGMEELRCRSPWKLSGGEKTLAALSGLLAMEPDTLLLDEPTAGLDPRSRRNFINIIRQTSCSVLIATHDLDMVLDVCGRVIILQAGRLAASSALPGLMEDEGFMRACGLELPLRYCGTRID